MGASLLFSLNVLVASKHGLRKQKKETLSLFSENSAAQKKEGKKTRSLQSSQLIAYNESSQLIAYNECWVAYHATSGIVSNITDTFRNLTSVSELSDFDSSDYTEYPEFAAYLCNVTVEYRNYYRNTNDDDDDDDDDGDDSDEEESDYINKFVVDPEAANGP